MSEFQYEPIVSPERKQDRDDDTEPSGLEEPDEHGNKTRVRNRAKPTIKIVERRLFRFTWSYRTCVPGLNCDFDGAPRLVVSLEELALGTKWNGPAINMLGNVWIFVL